MNGLLHPDTAGPSQLWHSSSRPRFGGLLIVAAIHVLMAWALISGLARQVFEAANDPIEARVVETPAPPPPPPPPPLQVERPKVEPPRPIFVPVPEIIVRAPPPPPVIQSPVVSTPPPRAELRPQRPAPPAPAAPAPVQAKAAPGPAKPEAICTRMGKPELPALSWTGTARYRATAIVKSGRVAQVQIQNLDRNVERRTQRLLARSIETALLETYECPGNHLFVQEFVIRLE